MRLVALGTCIACLGVAALAPPAWGEGDLPARTSDDVAAAPSCQQLGDGLLRGTARYRRTPRNLRRFIDAVDPLCFDFTGDGRRDVAFAIGSGGSGGAFDWAVFKRTPRSGGSLRRRFRKVAERHVDDGHLSLRRSGRRIVLTEPVYRRGDPNCCPTGGEIRRTYRVTARRLLLVRSVRRR